MYALANKVGRLVEIRIWSPVSLDEALRWGQEHNGLIDRVPGRYVCLVDLVDATVFPPEVVGAYVSVMKGEQRLLRTGTLLNPSPTFGMQIERMIKTANHPDRRAFRDPAALEKWLGEVLTPPEKRRLRELLAPRTLAG
jgi:hypothetical protein